LPDISSVQLINPQQDELHKLQVHYEGQEQRQAIVLVNQPEFDPDLSMLAVPIFIRKKDHMLITLPNHPKEHMIIVGSFRAYRDYKADKIHPERKKE
jgi:hypothetical protein